jgi:hypothetical protein
LWFGRDVIAKTFSLAMCIGAASLAAQPAPASLRDLTVGADRLPAGCVLSPAPTARLDGNSVRGGLWADLPSNPWIGTDPVRIASIVELMNPPRVPDGPPLLTPRETARFRVQLADGIDEGYGAVYLSNDPTGALTIVFALRFPSSDRAAGFLARRKASHNPRIAPFAIGPLVVLVTAANGACQPVAAYLKSLSR